VRHWLQLAADAACADDGENVHRLRVATRRASVALKAFRDLTDPIEADALRDALSQIRKAADVARNIDATSEHLLSQCADASDELREKLRSRLGTSRAHSQAPITAMLRKLDEAHFDERIKALLSHIKHNHPKRCLVPYGKQARRILKPVVKKFFRAAKSGVSNDDELHALRIRAKKLRYTMEITSVAFGPEFMDALYQKCCECQDIMGSIRDCVIMQELLRDWLATPCDDAERTFLKKLLSLETASHTRWMRTFHTLWKTSYVARLKRDFDTHLKSE